LLAFPLGFQELEIAGRALEGGETPRTAASTLDPSSAIQRRRDRGGPDQASENERPDASTLLLAIHHTDLTIAAVRVCTLGDLALDVTVRLAGPLAEGGDTPAEIGLSPGGQAANVVAWSSKLGAQSTFIGKRGADLAGQLAAEDLDKRGVRVLGPAEGKTGVVCALVSPDGQRSLAPDRGAAGALRPEEIEARWLAGCDHLFVSGYALFQEPVRTAARSAVAFARDEGASVSVDLSSWSALRNAGANEFRDLLTRLAPDVVFANEEEERVFGGPLPESVWILKRGARGCSFAGDERAALPVERVVDTTGAGDALAAGWIVGGADLALEAASQCVQQVGAMPVRSGSP